MSLFLVLIIVMYCLVVMLILNNYFLVYRNNKVYTLREHILYNYNITVYKSLPSYNRMVFSLKPLKEEYWIKK